MSQYSYYASLSHAEFVPLVFFPGYDIDITSVFCHIAVFLFIVFKVKLMKQSIFCCSHVLGFSTVHCSSISFSGIFIIPSLWINCCTTTDSPVGNLIQSLLCCVFQL